MSGKRKRIAVDSNKTIAVIEKETVKVNPPKEQVKEEPKKEEKPANPHAEFYDENGDFLWEKYDGT